MKEAIVKVRHLSHRYSVQWAVKDISFNIPALGIYGLLGSNGAGKSTVMNIMCGVLKQTEGEVFINEVDTRKDPLVAKKYIGFLPQQPPLYGDLTVEEYLTHAAYLRRMPDEKIRAAVDEVMERCSITHFRSRLIKNLSGGYQQRVGIAQAIVHKPALVVFDEPTSGLDPNQTLEIRHLVQSIAKECTVLLSTHILTEVHAICDYIFMIEQGQLVFNGTVNEFDNYLSANSIFLKLAAAPATNVLMDIKGIADVEELGGQSYRIRVSEEGVLERLVKASSQNRWRLMEIRQEKSSLDDIFAALSKKSKEVKF